MNQKVRTGRWSRHGIMLSFRDVMRRQGRNASTWDVMRRHDTYSPRFWFVVIFHP